MVVSSYQLASSVHGPKTLLHVTTQKAGISVLDIRCTQSPPESPRCSILLMFRGPATVSMLVSLVCCIHADDNGNSKCRLPSEDIEYLEKHHIPEMVDELLSQLMRTRPENPADYLREVLMKKHTSIIV